MCAIKGVWPGCQTACAKRKLSRVQILTCLVIKVAKRTNPSIAVETLIWFSPLDLVVYSEGRTDAHRLWCLRYWSYLHPNQGHSRILMRFQQSDPIFNMGFDVMNKAFKSIQKPKGSSGLQMLPR